MDALAQIDSWSVPTVAAGVVTADGRVATRGPAAARFYLASVTKALFAYAVLVAVEEGSVGLDDPAGPPGSTVRHLLCHASGLGFSSAKVLTAPGRRRIYSNTGFHRLGQHLAGETGMAPAEYLHQAVLEPLAMASTALEGSPAAHAHGTVDDLLRFAAELLQPTVLAPATMAEAVSVQLPGLAGMLPGIGSFDPLDWGLGFELRGGKQPHWTGTRNSPATFGHFGGSGTFLWVDPALAAACVVLTDQPFGPWALEVWPRLSDAVVAELG